MSRYAYIVEVRIALAGWHRAGEFTSQAEAIRDAKVIIAGDRFGRDTRRTGLEALHAGAVEMVRVLNSRVKPSSPRRVVYAADIGHREHILNEPV